MPFSEQTTVTPDGNKFYIVGIGVSADGLEAVIQLAGRLQPNFPCAYVVVQQASSEDRGRQDLDGEDRGLGHCRSLAEILSRETAFRNTGLRITEVRSGLALAGGTIYLVPAGASAVVSESGLTLAPPVDGMTPRLSINRFFCSLAEEKGDDAVGIVLSGAGCDGTAGLRAIQAAGGITFAQTPEPAGRGGMPQAAIAAGVADYVLAPAEMPGRLYRLLGARHGAGDRESEIFAQLLDRLKQTLGLDFSAYRPEALMRRLKRRQTAAGMDELSAYLASIESRPSELEALARDMLIPVTAFFRDAAAFHGLKNIVRKLCDEKPPGSEIRVWIAGCASGEEAYSVSMIFAEVLAKRLPRYRLQIFATDIDEAALASARRGIYSAAALADIAPAILERYFLPVDRVHYEVGKTLRDLVVFARHDVAKDLPFHRLDLIACRNVLAYFDTPLREKLVQSFYLALKKEGYLFLGRSESIAQVEALFSAVEQRERLFRKSAPTAPAAAVGGKGARVLPPRHDRKIRFLLTGLVEHLRLTAVLIDAEGCVQHTAGQVERFLQFPAGAADPNIGEAVIPALRGEILTLLHQFRQAGKAQRGRKRKIGRDMIRLAVAPVGEIDGQAAMILFMPEKSGAAPAPQPAEDELTVTREQLQDLVGEMATVNQEMQTLNEEAQAVNEELQAANQELASLNEELNCKTREVFNLSEEYAHLYDVLEFPILAFDRGLRLLRFNKAAAEHLRLHSGLSYQPVGCLNLPAPLKKLEELLVETERCLAPAQYRFTLDDRHWRLAINPSLDAEGAVRNLIVTFIDLTEITRTQAQLEESKAQMTALMENTTIKFAMKDLKGNYLYANSRFLWFFDIDADDYIGKNDFILLPSEIAASFWNDNIEALRKRETILKEYLLDVTSGQRHLRIVNQLLCDAAGQPTAFLIEAEDITAEKKAEQQLKLTAKVFDQAGEAIVVTNGRGLIQTVNAAFTDITGYRKQESIGQSISQLLRTNRHPPEFYTVLSEALKNTGFWQGEIWNRRKNGEIFPEWLTVNRIDNSVGQIEHYVSIFSDISSLKESQEKAEYLATHDLLTDLPNRTLFMDRLRQALSTARRHKTRVALLFIDLDNFKVINDTLGHDVGDELLKMAAGRLQKAVREIDTIARLGGDEFTAILVECDENTSERIAQRIVDDLSSSYLIESRILFVSASVGIAFYPEDSQDSIGLVKAADTAMYRAKEEGRNRIEFFKPDLHTKLFKTRALENGLREALAHNRFYLVYQPKFALAEPYPIKGAEVMLRWQDPELGDIAPLEFIPIAENSGLITDITDKMIGMLLVQIETWRQEGVQAPAIAVNISPKCIREINFSRKLIERMRGKSIAFERLQIEITEGALLENISIVKTNLLALSKAGIRIAIDDFGTGYSSLGYLKRLPLSELKIDKSFVDGLGTEPEDEAIAQAVLNLSKALGLQTVAEGVETREQLIWLNEHGCDQAQGFLLSRPLTAEGFAALLSKSR